MNSNKFKDTLEETEYNEKDENYFWNLRNELMDKFEKESFNCFLIGEMESSKFIDSTMYLVSPNDNSILNTLLKFMKFNNLKNAFYMFSYYDENKYYISNELIDKLDSAIYELVKDDIKKYNDELDEIDFLRPCAMTIFCIFENRHVAVESTDLWNELPLAEEVLFDFIENKKNDVKKIKDDRELEKEQIIETVKEYIRNDEEFIKCTNQQLRESYAKKLFNKNEFKEYEELFLFTTGRPNYLAFETVELVWREYKYR
jgi:hypothetical protein